MFPALPSSRDVEVALRRHPCVWDAATVEVTDRHGHLVMAAVVQLAAPLPDAAAELAEYCRVRLPASQVPAQWVVSGPDSSANPATSPASSPQAPDCRHAGVDIPQQAHRAPHLDA
jgi:acyl-CoA synthetase (AMP-forming)/AMP-acid ligase II